MRWVPDFCSPPAFLCAKEMGLVENDECGRMITKEGQRELDTVAVQAAAEEEEEEED